MHLSVMHLKPLWLLDVDLFLNDFVEEGGLHIHLMFHPISKTIESTARIEEYLTIGAKVAS
jgi:hypothetical protein